LKLQKVHPSIIKVIPHGSRGLINTSEAFM